MLYTIIYTNAKGRERKTILQADTITNAHKLADPKAKKGETVKVYCTPLDTDGTPDPLALQASALTVVKRTTANMISREGGTYQQSLWEECRKPIYANWLTADGETVKQFDPDIKDMLSVSANAFCIAYADGVNDVSSQYKVAYLALNTYLRANKAINLSETAMKTIYIEDINGDIINVNSTIAKIIKYGEYVPVEPDNDSETLVKQRAMISAILATLTQPQKDVARLLANGYSERQIAEKLHKGKTTIHKHITLIRKKALSLYPDGINTK